MSDSNNEQDNNNNQDLKTSTPPVDNTDKAAKTQNKGMSDEEINTIINEVSQEEQRQRAKQKQDIEKDHFTKDEVKQLLAAVNKQKEDTTTEQINDLKKDLQDKYKETEKNMENLNTRKGAVGDVNNPFRDANGKVTNPYLDPNLTQTDRANLFLNQLDKGAVVVAKAKSDAEFDAVLPFKNGNVREPGYRKRVFK